MKVIKYLGVVGYFITVVIIGLSFFTAQICEEQLSRAIVYQKITSKVLSVSDSVLPYIVSDDEISETDAQIEEFMSNNEALNQIVTLYFDAIKKMVVSRSTEKLEDQLQNGDISVGDYVDADALTTNVDQFSSDLVAMIEDECNLTENSLSQLFSEQMIEQLSLTLNSKITNECDAGLLKLSSRQLMMVKMYVVITSTFAHIVLSILTIAFLALSVLGSRPLTKCLLPLGIVNLLAGICWLILAGYLKTLIIAVINRISTITTQIQITPWRIYAVVLLAIGVILSILGIIFGKLETSRKDDFLNGKW